MTPLLEVENLSLSYGFIRAVRGVAFAVAEGETVAIVGANGAGKTTLLRGLSNVLPREAGTVRFAGRDTAGLSAHALTRAGLLHVPEGRGTLGRLTVAENLRIAFDRQPSPEPFEAAAARVFARFPRLKERFGIAAGNLSGGEQQMLALARAVVNRPKLLLVDEPSLGLSPRMSGEAFAVIRDLKADGIAIVLVEQNARAALALADTGYVMSQGRFAMSGPAPSLAKDPATLKHYLGG